MHSSPSVSHQLQPQQVGMPTPLLAAPAIDQKIGEIRSRVLEIIRAAMPITSLFTPALKIDLPLFLNDQMIFQRLAVFIAPLAGKEDLNPDQMEKHFEGSELLAEIKGMFKETAPNLHPFYTACCDVLGQKAEAAPIQPALEARIYTLKNALVALQTPAAIQNSQKLNKIPVQKPETIKEEGLQFIKAALSIHVRSLESADALPFRERLSRTIEQLLPFVNQITCSYLQEHDRAINENPFTFRNPSGYNCHGEVASAVLEACLSALGYNTLLLSNWRLEPRVTLALHHAIVKVSGPDNTTFMIDPCYRQFHKDILLDESKVPQAPFLLLESREVAGYIDANIMPLWRSTFSLVTHKTPGVIEKLYDEDKQLAYIIHQHDLTERYDVTDIEAWVRESFRKIWDMALFTRVIVNPTYHAIFEGSNDIKGTYEKIKAMNIAPLTHYTSVQELEKRLNHLCQEPSQIGAKSAEALELLAQLSYKKRLPYRKLLDVDSRINAKISMEPFIQTYYRFIREIVNPDGQNVKAVYGCSGADALSLFLATDVQEATFVDHTELSLEDLKQQRKLLTSSYTSYLESATAHDKKEPSFFGHLSFTCSSLSELLPGYRHRMADLPFKLLFNLGLLGVDLKQIKISQKNGGIQLDFSWAYRENAEPKKRRITFIRGDITDPKNYPESLKKTLAAGIDMFYMKAAYWVPQSFPKFLPHIAASIGRGGWLLMAETTVTMDDVDPTPCLTKAGHTFVKKESEELAKLEEVIQDNFKPLSTILALSNQPRSIRYQRKATAGEHYWSFLKLRQKV